MTREEIRRMKQEQRRKQEANMEGDEHQSYGGGNYATSQQSVLLSRT